MMTLVIANDVEEFRDVFFLTLDELNQLVVRRY
jgi:hypothetical protein